MNTPQRELEVVRDRDRAEVLLHPLRLRILDAARQPDSAAGLARRLGEKPQNVNYHVGRLAEHGFLRKVGERRAGNLTETVYGAVAERFVLASEVLGPLAPESDPVEQGTTAGQLLALQARTESELGALIQGAGEAEARLGALALSAEFRFETAQQRTIFARAVRELFGAVVSKYTSPSAAGKGPSAPVGRPYRMLLGVYPVPETEGPLEGVEARTPGSGD